MAYTKYSLTPANNTATPPDGAPEGMLPSAVNDTMRDMMAQIRDCGDGIRDGTYTMTAAKITGGTITGVTFTGNTFSNPTITGVSTFAAGTVSAPAITTSGDTNTGIYFPAADTIAFAEGGAEAMRIDSSGNVGIGSTTPNSYGRLQVKQPSTTYSSGLTVTTQADDSSLFIYDSGSAWNFLASYLSTGSYKPIVFNTGNAERMRIDSSGNVLVGITSARANAGDVQVSKGISFPATQSAQSDANTLDDYEEGTWTPNQGSGLTVIGAFSSSGRYIKIGRIIYIEGTVAGATSVSVSSTGIISGNLPFTSVSGTSSGLGGLTNNSINVSNTCWVANGGTALYATVAVSATVQLWFSATYYADA